MAYQAETAEWTKGVYRIQTSDETLGFRDGAAGFDNKPLEDLAKRTRWLKEKIGNVEALLCRT
jgi:hypothetical protein